jgi:phage terminase large subunit
MAAQPSWIDAPIPEKLGFFLQEGFRYKGARGGRGGGKSRTIATALVIKGYEKPIRWLCARETQKSLKYSSRQIIVDAINRLGLNAYFRILEDEIRGTQVDSEGRFTVFMFAGIRELSVDSIKSLEDFDGIWISEAHNVSEESWKKITPTFRREKAEIWFDYNPELDEDFIHRWSNDPPPNARIVHVNYYDNPWFPEVLRIDMEHMKAKDPDGYRHVWLGEAKNSVVGAVYGKEMAAAYSSQRIVLNPGIGIDQSKLIDIFFDLGHGDPMALWFAQTASGWFNLVDFYQNEREAIEHYAAVIKERGYLIGTLWLPWDGVDAQLHHNLTGSNMRSPEMVLRGLGFKVRISPKVSVDNGIAAVRTIFPQLRFNEPKCFEGIRNLRMYQYGAEKEDGKVITKPKHDKHSHAADALRTLAVSIREPENEERRVERPRRAYAEI